MRQVHQNANTTYWPNSTQQTGQGVHAAQRRQKHTYWANESHRQDAKPVDHHTDKAQSGKRHHSGQINHSDKRAHTGTTMPRRSMSGITSLPFHPGIQSLLSHLSHSIQEIHPGQMHTDEPFQPAKPSL
ncbi:hypothetical protein Nepgr_027595 [Nepenthes gracilis]|uniref:Uncharacterized protein n=1 Tax=Nepenthes gracilis TaxID=150966 RepID=A0AAD3Y1C5_NEPGR|nr:hypothetical protein Nepgr_027595 [Nepenthes gracilis]